MCCVHATPPRLLSDRLLAVSLHISHSLYVCVRTRLPRAPQPRPLSDPRPVCACVSQQPTPLHTARSAKPSPTLHPSFHNSSEKVKHSTLVTPETRRENTRNSKTEFQTRFFFFFILSPFACQYKEYSINPTHHTATSSSLPKKGGLVSHKYI